MRYASENGYLLQHVDKASACCAVDLQKAKSQTSKPKVIIPRHTGALPASEG
jgi:hypothetical protein